MTPPRWRGPKEWRMKTNTIARILLAAALACGSGCARPDWIEQTLVTVDVSGVWRGTVGTATLELALQQDGPKVTGHLKQEVNSSASGPLEGTVSGDTFRFRTLRGGLTGELQVEGDEMTGTVLGGGGRQRFSLRREP